MTEKILWFINKNIKMEGEFCKDDKTSNWTSNCTFKTEHVTFYGACKTPLQFRLKKLQNVLLAARNKTIKNNYLLSTAKLF